MAGFAATRVQSARRFAIVACYSGSVSAFGRASDLWSLAPAPGLCPNLGLSSMHGFGRDQAAHGRRGAGIKGSMQGGRYNHF